MQALVAEAHRLGRKVATHAHSAQSIKDAVRAGVDSIEHGIFMDEECIQLMKQHGTYLSATTYPLFWYEKNEDSLHLPPWVIEKVAMIIPAAKVNVARAYKEGVKVALGTDAGVYPHGLNGGEFWSMVQLGLTPVQSLQAGTVNAADLMGWTDKIGVDRSGKICGHRRGEWRSTERHHFAAACGFCDEGRSGLQRKSVAGASAVCKVRKIFAEIETANERAGCGANRHRPKSLNHWEESLMIQKLFVSAYFSGAAGGRGLRAIQYRRNHRNGSRSARCGSSRRDDYNQQRGHGAVSQRDDAR